MKVELKPLLRYLDTMIENQLQKNGELSNALFVIHDIMRSTQEFVLGQISIQRVLKYTQKHDIDISDFLDHINTRKTGLVSDESMYMSYCDSSRIHVNFPNTSETEKQFKLQVDRFQGLHDPKAPDSFYQDIRLWFQERSIQQPEKQHILRYLKISKKTGFIKDLHFIHWKLTKEKRNDIRDYEYSLFTSFYNIKDKIQDAMNTKLIVGIFYSLICIYKLDSENTCIHIMEKDRQIPVHVRKIIYLSADVIHQSKERNGGL